MDRAKITVTEVKPVTEFGEKHTKKLTFSGKTEPEGKALQYQSYRESLFETVKVGAVLDIEFETKTREGSDGNTYTDRKVQQIYVNGQPVAEQKGFGSGGRPFGKSPEERQSIEKQVALKEIGENLRCGTVDIPQGFIDWYWQAIGHMLGAYLADPPHPAAVPPKTPPVPALIKTQAQPDASEPIQLSQATEDSLKAWAGTSRPTPSQQSAKSEASEPLFWPHLEKLGDLMHRANVEHNIKLADIYSDLGVKGVKEITMAPDDAWMIIAQKRNLKPK
mgnify:CR=1 FL=1